MRIIMPLEMLDLKGGMPQSVELLVRFLPASVEKVMVVPQGSKVSTRMAAAGAEVVCLKEERWTVGRESPARTLRTFVSFRRGLRPLLTPTSVLVTNNIASELLCGLGNPWPHTPRIFINRGDAYGGVSATALKRSLRSCRACVATTDYQRDTLVRTLGVEVARVRTIPNGVDLSELDGPQSAKPSWYRTGRVHIATIGYPSERKNQALLIKAIGVLKRSGIPVAGIIVGSPGCDGDQRYLESLKLLAHQLDLGQDIIFQPFVDDKRKVFWGVDIMASTATREGFGRTLIEAMAVGCPVVALRAGGPECIIQHEMTGLLVSNNAPEEFAAALKRIIECPTLASRLVENGRRDCRGRYDAGHVASQYFSLFSEVSSQITTSLRQQQVEVYR